MPSSFQIGTWTAHPDHNQLVHGKDKVKLEPRIMQVLVFLAQHADEVVSREHILEAVWKDVVVSDEVLTNAVRELRKVLGDDAKEPQFIQTIPKQGYRLIAPVFRDVARPVARRGRTVVGRSVLAGAAIAVGIYFFVSKPERPSPRILPLTTYVEHERYPALSPDGKQVAFAWDRNGNWDLYVKLIGGGEPLQLTRSDRHEVSPVWSPDGNQIAFLRETGEGSDIVVMPALGGAERILGTTATKRQAGPTWSPGLDWSPDGRWLATADRESPGEGAGIFLFSTESGERLRRTTPPPEQFVRDKEPAFSPDGHQLAFVRGFGITGYEIRLHSLEDGSERLLASVEGIHTDLGWTANGSALVYATELEGRARLWKVNVSNRRNELLAVGENAVYFSVARAGGGLVYSTYWSRDCNIWRVAGPATDERLPPERVIVSTAMEWLPVYSPDGARIAFNSRRSGAAGIWVCDNDGSNCSQLVERGLSPHWSPDGGSIAYAWEGDLYAVGIRDGFVRQLTSDSYLNLRPRWSRDGQWLYFTSSRSGRFEVWKMAAAEGGAAKQLTHGGGVGVRESEDCRFFYFFKATPPSDAIANQPHHVWKVPVDGGEETPVLEETVYPGACVFWKDQILFRRIEAEGRRSLHLFDPETGETRRFVELEAGHWCIGLDISADGRWILFSRGPTASSDFYLIENFF